MGLPWKWHNGNFFESFIWIVITQIKRRNLKNHSILLVKDRMEVIQLMISLKIETLLEGKAVERNWYECIIKKRFSKTFVWNWWRKNFFETTIFIREGLDESEEMSDKEKDRMNVIIMYLEKPYEISSDIAGVLLDVGTKTVSRLLNNAEKCRIVRDEEK